MISIISLSRGQDRNVRTVEATFQRNGELVPLLVNSEDRPEVYNEIEKLLAREGLDIEAAGQELFSLMSPEAKVQQQISSSYYLSESLAIRDGHVFFNDHRLEETLTEHMLSLLDEENAPKDEKMWRSYVKFLDNLHQNANEEIRKQLFRWMEYENNAGNGFGITDDGMLVGYKGCSGSVLEPMSVFSGNAIVDGVEFKGHIPNKAGSVIQMPRSAVQNDPSVGCSVGLHVGTRDYATRWAPVLLLVKVNPRDVVSVPYECDSQKMRVCEYTVLKVTDATDEHKMYHGSDNDYDDSDDILTSNEAYNLLGKDIYVEYDNIDGEEESAQGEVVDVYEDGATNIIIEVEDGEYVDIELHRVSYFESEDEIEEDYVLDVETANDLLEVNEEVWVVYGGGKTHQGVVVDVYEEFNKHPGVIVKNDEDEYKHIKLYRIENWGVVDEDDEVFMDLSMARALLDSDETIFVEYGGGKTHQGVVVNVYDEPGKKSGVIVKNAEGEYKHIKLNNIEDWDIVETDEDEDCQDDFLAATSFTVTSLDELNEAVKDIYKSLVEGSQQEPTQTEDYTDNCCEGECEGFCGQENYKEIIELELGSEVVVIYDAKEKGLKLFKGEVVFVSKWDMTFSLVDENGNGITINFTDVVTLQKY